VFGSNNNVGSALTNVGIIGNVNHITASNAYIIGNNATNNLPNTIQLGANVTNLYPFTANTCSLGLSTSMFQNAFLSNNCYLNGKPTAICEFSSYTTLTVSSDQETLYSNVSAVGSLTLPPLQVGAVVRVKVNFTVTVANTPSGDAIHLYLKSSVSGVLSSPFITTPSNTALLDVIGEMTYTMTVRDTANAYVFASGNIFDTNNGGAQQLASYDSTISQDLILSAQWDTGVTSHFTVQQIIVESLFRTS
jgi:hypothetical protein